MQVLKLATGRQREIFRLLQRHSLPEFYGSLYADFGNALDFLQAFLKYRHENLDDQWSQHQIMPEVRKKSLLIEPLQVSVFADEGMNLWGQGLIDINALLLPFSSSPGDVSGAVSKIEHIISACFRENMVQIGQQDAMVLMPLLIASAETTHTWNLLVKGVSSGHPGARDAFRHFVGFLGLLQINPTFLDRSNLPGM